MKKNIFLPVILLMTLLYSCNSNNTDSTTTKDTTVTAPMATDTANSMSSNTDSKMSNNATPDQASTDFVSNAAIAGMMEIELGKAAMSKTKNKRVGDYAAMLVNDHNAAAAELKSIASANNITVPAELPADKKDHVDMLKKKSGTDFDKAYMDMMVNDHNKVIDDFKKASKELKNDALKNFATKTTPVLEKHLDSAKAINKMKM